MSKEADLNTILRAVTGLTVTTKPTGLSSDQEGFSTVEVEMSNANWERVHDIARGVILAITVGNLR